MFMKSSINLQGKYVFIATNDYYKYGKITEKIGDDFFMVQIISGDAGACGTNLYHINHMQQDDTSPGGLVGWSFFNNKTSLMKYVNWLEKADEKEEGKVLQLVK